jgi:CheY-like chemotaxis protein
VRENPSCRQFDFSSSDSAFIMASDSRRSLILLVEDSEDDAFFFRWALKKSGCVSDLEHVTNGATAIERLKASLDHSARRPDLVFLDLKIPNFNGFEVLDWIKGQPFAPKLPVLVLSGSEHASDIQRATDLGATGYHVKPLSVDDLRSHLAARSAAA